MPSGVLIIAETRNGKIRSVTNEIASAGRKLADEREYSCSALVIGNGVTEAGTGLGAYGVENVYVADHEALDAYSGTSWLKATLKVVEIADPEYILLAASSTGRDLAPRIAAALGAGYAAACTGFNLEDGALLLTRPVYAGKLMQQIHLTTPVGIISLLPKSYTADGTKDISPEVDNLDVSWASEEGGIVATAVEATEGAKVDLTEADRIVSGGRGMGGPDNWGLLEEVAGLLGAEIGASRAVVDAGWRPHSEQVGQTGKTVTPGLYIACGISGAMQHLAGMSRSKVIVAVNRDPEAPIFGVADYGIVGSVLDVLPKMAEELRTLEE